MDYLEILFSKGFLQFQIISTAVQRIL